MSRKAGTVPEETRTRLLESVAAEFSQYGFQKASLRRICTNAGVTTGALYFFFQDKDDLFRNVLSPVTEGILSLMETHYDAELSSPVTDLIEDGSGDFQTADEFMSLYFSHQTLCDILLSNRDHPAVCSFFDRLIFLMDRQTVYLLEQLYPDFSANSIFNEHTLHWISHLQIDAVLHILSHGLNEAEAKEQLKIMVAFLRGGFLSLLPGLTQP